jgi:hypothetical protein
VAQVGASPKKADSFYFDLGGVSAAAPTSVGSAKPQSGSGRQSGRTSDDSAVWMQPARQVCSAMMDGKFAANVSAAYSTGTVRWRNASKPR